MMKTSRIVAAAFLAVALLGLAFWITASRSVPARVEGAGASPGAVKVTVYSSPTCSCCGVYIDYLRGEGFNVQVVTVRDTEAVKARHGIPAQTWSCHTSVVGDYFVEGHVPAEAIEKLLADAPDIDGIALPGMPGGSPGMGGSIDAPLEVLAVTHGQTTAFSTHR